MKMEEKHEWNCKSRKRWSSIKTSKNGTRRAGFCKQLIAHRRRLSVTKPSNSIHFSKQDSSQINRVLEVCVFFFFTFSLQGFEFSQK